MNFILARFSPGLRTLGAALEEVKGIGPGFDSLRILLSISVVIWHGVHISYGSRYEEHVWHDSVPGALAATVLPVFFALSGFLVMASAVRTQSLRRFLAFRVLRIAPALTTEVLLSALVLGPLLTSLPLSDYFSSPLFFRYFANVFGLISYQLPGVFTTNPSPLVNFSLWTIPPELGCYFYMALCIVTGIYLRRRKMMLGMFIVLLIIGCRKYLSHQHLILAAPGQDNLFLCFILGNLFYLYREKIVLDWRLFVLALAGGAYCIQNTLLIYLGSLLLTYCTVYLGLCRIPRLPLMDRGDYSYGIYLYGFPVQQTVAYLFPASREWYLNALFSLPVIIALAALSWHIIERPSLSLKKVLQGRRAKAIQADSALG